jgi:hypothetical protein
MSRRHARPRRVLAAAAAVARDWWDRANQRMERRDVFAHIPQAPDGWSPRDEWADPLEVHHHRPDRLDQLAALYVPAPVREERATATASEVAAAPVPDRGEDLTETGYRAAQKAQLARRLAQELIDAVSPAAITRNAFDYCLSDVYRRISAWQVA